MQERALQSKDRATPKKHLFSDKLFCSDYGKKLWAISNRGFYICGTYKKKGKGSCTIHKIKEKDLVEIIQEDLKKFSANMNDIVGAKKTLEDRLKSTKLQYEKKLISLQDKKGKLVLKFIDDAITKVAYDAAVGVVDRDILMTKKALNNLYEENDLESEQEKLIRVHEQFHAIKNFDVINHEVINRFLDKIVVHEDFKVEIQYAFHIS